MTSVLIVDDQPLVRRGLHEMLSDDPSIAAIGEAPNAALALALARARAWDIVILDIGLPDASGVSVLRKLRRERPAQRIIMFSFHTAPSVVRLCLRAGAAGYVAKDAGPDELLDAVRTVLAGRVYVSRTVAEALRSLDGHSPSADPEQGLPPS